MTNAGTANGAVSAARHQRVPGNEVRSTSQAAPVPMMALRMPAPITRAAVLISSSPTRGRAINTSDPRHPNPATEAMTNSNGSRLSMATITAGANIPDR